jgi:hypothetical protein
MTTSVPEIIKRACSFVIKIDTPLETTKDILEFLIQRRIMLQTMQMHGVGSGEGILILHCLIEKDRLQHVQRALQKLNGILSVELLESRISNIVKL